MRGALESGCPVTFDEPDMSPADKRPRCRHCGGRWNGSNLLLCSACEDDYLDLLNEDSRSDLDIDERDPDEGLAF